MALDEMVSKRSRPKPGGSQQGRGCRPMRVIAEADEDCGSDTSCRWVLRLVETQ